MLSAWERTHSGALVLPPGGHGVLFSVPDGLVRLLEIIGLVTEQIQDQVNNAKLTLHCDSGSDVDLCTAINIQNDAVGTMYSITGILSDAMRKTPCGAFKSQSNPIVAVDGTIDLVCDAVSSGAVRWITRWAPLDAGARIITL